MAMRCLLVVLVSVLFGTPKVQGTLSFSLVGYTTTIPTDGSGRILITNIGFGNDDALMCITNTPNPGNGEYYLHPSMVTISDSDRIQTTDTRGWSRSRALGLARLRRYSTSWTEGVFTCQFSGISDPPISVGVYYPITAVSVSITVVSAREGTHTVTCTTTGGTVLSGELTVPDGINTLNFSPVGTLNYRGQDSYRASTGTRTRGSNGATYQCTATNGVSSPDESGSTTLKVAGPPTMVSAQQVAPGSSISVTWMAPSGGAPVTGYTVHYSSGMDTGSVNVGSPTITTTITGRINDGRINDGRTYTITVVARSEHLSGESTATTVILIAPPDRPSNVRVTNIQPHSVNVMWNTQSGVASYTVQYTKTEGASQQGECKSETQSGSVSTTDASTSITVQGSGNDMLRAFTTYSITVTAASVTSLLGSSAPSTAVVVTTAQTGATSPPSNVTVTAVNSSSILVIWGPIQSCRDRNGNIKNYNIKYQPVDGSGSVKNEIVSGMGSAGGQVLLDGLTPFTDYSIQVAAVNNQSTVGVFSTAVTGQISPPALVPVILPSPASATAGEVVELSCSVPVVEHLGQSPTLDWSGGSVGQLGVAVTDLTTLGGTIWRNISFSPLKTSHGGQYVCQANLSVPAIALPETWASSRDLSVQIPRPVVTVSGASDGTVLESDSSLELTCSIQPQGVGHVDTPSTIISRWSPPSSQYSRDSAANASTVALSIPSVVTADSGAYTCTASVSDSSGSGYVVDSLEVMESISITVSVLIQLRLSRVTVCSEWVTDQTELKVADITSKVKEQLSTSCQCANTSSPISEASFACFDDSPTHVTYRARLTGTQTVSTASLLSILETWVSSQPVISVKSVLMRIDSQCSVAISSFSERECSTHEPSTTSGDNTAAIIGGVVAVIVLIVIVQVGIIAAVLFRCRRGSMSIKTPEEHSMTTIHGPVSGITTTSNMAYELVKHRAGPQGRRRGGGKGEFEPVEYEEVVSSPPPLSSAAVGAGGYEVPTVPSPHKHTPLPAQPLANNGGGGGGKGGGEEEGVYEVLPGEQ